MFLLSLPLSIDCKKRRHACSPPLLLVALAIAAGDPSDAIERICEVRGRRIQVSREKRGRGAPRVDFGTADDESTPLLGSFFFLKNFPQTPRFHNHFLFFKNERGAQRLLASLSNPQTLSSSLIEGPSPVRHATTPPGPARVGRQAQEEELGFDVSRRSNPGAAKAPRAGTAAAAPALSGCGPDCPRGRRG